MQPVESPITTKEAAQKLQVHARTIRKWIDVFEEYICPDLNERGHYMLDEESMDRLIEIQSRLQEPNKSMKQVKEDLLNEGKMESTLQESSQTLSWRPMMESMDHIEKMLGSLFHRMDRLEDHLFGLYDTLEDLEQKFVALSFDSISANEVHQMFDEIRKKQDQFKIELRNVSFTQRMNTTTETSADSLPRRQKRGRFLFFF